MAGVRISTGRVRFSDGRLENGSGKKRSVINGTGGRARQRVVLKTGQETYGVPAGYYGGFSALNGCYYCLAVSPHTATTRFQPPGTQTFPPGKINKTTNPRIVAHAVGVAASGGGFG